MPAGFFEQVLGPHRKYGACLWADGQQVLELGCGWGSLSLWMAGRYPASRITALSSARPQRAFIEEQARVRGLANLRVLTADINRFDTRERFDRIVSVEMFEHLRNWPQAFARVARWLAADGRFFLHVFAHRGAPYPFEVHDASDWMGRYCFSGGMMPSDDLALRCQDDLRALDHWHWSGTHYQRTAAAWLASMDHRRERILPLLAARRGQVMDQGLWRHTRHPNCFGEACVWRGPWAMAAPAGWPGLAAVVSPLLMAVLLLRVSGVRLLEQDIAERRPAYRDYVARTNAFFPGPVRRPAP